MIFPRFLTTLRRFPKIFQNCPEDQTNVPEHFPRISEDVQRCPKISEDFRRFSRKTRRCFDDTPTKLSTTWCQWIIDIFTCEDMISSHMRISYRFNQFVATRYTTDFYIINSSIQGPSAIKCVQSMRHEARDSGSKYALLLLLCRHISLLIGKRLDTNLLRRRIRKYPDSPVHTLPDLLRINFFLLWKADSKIPGYVWTWPEVPVGIWIRDKFKLKIDRSVKTTWQEYGVVAGS